MAKDNRTLGRFHLDGIPSAPRGIPAIVVTFDLDANGILSVTAQDKATGKQNSIRIEGGSQLTKDEIERMKREAEENKEADDREKERIDKINSIDNFIFQTEKQIKELEDKIVETDKMEIEESLSQLKKQFESKNLDDIDRIVDSINQKWHSITTKLYQDSQKPNTETSETQDVQYEEVDESKS
jgi:molecular chaperone DnaK